MCSCSWQVRYHVPCDFLWTSACALGYGSKCSLLVVLSITSLGLNLCYCGRFNCAAVHGDSLSICVYVYHDARMDLLKQSVSISINKRVSMGPQ